MLSKSVSVRLEPHSCQRPYSAPYTSPPLVQQIGSPHDQLPDSCSKHGLIAVFLTVMAQQQLRFLCIEPEHAVHALEQILWDRRVGIKYEGAVKVKVQAIGRSRNELGRLSVDCSAIFASTWSKLRP